MSNICAPASCSAKSVRTHSALRKPGRQAQGQLWSNLAVICDLLKLPRLQLRKEEMLFQHIQYKTGQCVHAAGQRFDSFQIINCGFIKTAQINELGNEQILRFPMKGDILGLDAIENRHYTSEAIALSDCDVILMPFKKLCALGHTHLEFENFLFEVISHQLSREREIISMLGGLGAEARVARFLLTLSSRFAAMGYSDRLFNLRMRRQDIGSYLGITLETVSRTLTSFRKLGLITVNRSTIGIKNPGELANLRRLPPSRPRPRSIGDSSTQRAPVQSDAAAAARSVHGV